MKGIHNDDGAPIEEGWELFNLLDHGDFVGVEGFLFVTKTGELSVHVNDLQFLAKALLPMPDKMHGIADPEIRQRQRYADLIAGSLKVLTEEEKSAASRELSSREAFERRSKIIREMRRFLDDHGFIEVETPMLSPKATGAVARPFVTHHNALDIDLYARIAPELYLKRLLVGGFEKVYELNRNFRNEGIDRTHNPEFTMLEFYQAYMDVNGMMDFCEEIIRSTVFVATGHSRIRYEELEIDFSHPFERLTMKEAIAKSGLWPRFSEYGGPQFTPDWFDDPRLLDKLIRFIGALEKSGDISTFTPEMVKNAWQLIQASDENIGSQSDVYGEVVIAQSIEQLFNDMIETDLITPTFIIDFPKAISPLSKASPTDPTIAERFELFIAGMECANGFSELNDPEEQYERFLEQARARERGDEEAMVLDEDYIRALSYGMPPAAGIGIGIDRITMLLTGKRSIRDVILFPHMRPERKTEQAEETKS